jgi:deoxyribodipyrimidine photolyase-related protein
MDIFLILPTQLFEKKHLDKSYKYVIWEHPHYFTKYNYNKKKLILHRGSMRYYYDYLKNNKYKVEYVPFTEKIKITNYKIFDPVDKIKLPGKYEMIETPNFLVDKELYAKYRKKTDKFFFNSFYMWCKKEVDILPGVKSKDKYNRKSLPKNIKFPKLTSNKQDNKYINEAIKYVNKHFPDNYGNTDNFLYPLTHKTAKKWLNNFVKNKLSKFGPYQDAIDKDNNFMYHSILSTSINIGLLNPTDIVKLVMKNKKKVPINSLEGYIRQLFWREYQRYCYIYFNFNRKNYFGNKKKLTKKWYDATTGIDPIDNCIRDGFDTGYLHHIERLMVVGNFMNLYGLHPKEGFKWFMEFSCDNYE